MITTKGRYALRVLIDMSEHNNGSFIPAREIAERQNISPKYLEKILAVLVKNKFVEAMHGKGGGCRLTRDPDQYTIWEVLFACEGEMAPVACLGCEATPCELSPNCRTLPMWREYYEIEKKFFESKTIADLMGTDLSENYVI